MTDSQRIGSITVAGAGIVGLSAALAFAQALPRARVQLLDLEPDPAALADRMPGTLPAIRHFHRLIGLGEAELLREAGATHRIGTRFENWSPDGEPFYHCFGRHGVNLKSSPFQHQWARARAENRALSFDSYAPVAALARAEKFVHPVEDQSSLLASFDYALRLDPELYRRRLKLQAGRARIAVRDGAIGGVERRSDGGAAALLLDDGSRIESDLFIDCAGPRAPILSAIDDRFDDWCEFLPVDRLLLAVAAPREPTPVDRASATPEGWRTEIALLPRTLVVSAFSSAITDEAQARAALDSPDCELIELRPGRRPESWVRNVVAFGDSAVAVDPLESTNLHLAQSAIRRAISLLPDRDFHPLVLREFNRRTAAEADRVRDFIAVHYLAARRRDGDFWRSMPDRRRPDSLRHTLEQFEGRGRLPKFEEESFDDDSWLAVLCGLGLEPRRIDPTALRVDVEESSAAMERIARLSAQVPAQLPSYRDYLARLVAGRP